jgi:spore germination protein YaaH
MLSNDFKDIAQTSFFLNSQEARENAIRSVLVYAVALGIDGVNVDIENVYLKDRDALTQFVRELAPMLREQGLAVSVCVGVPDGSDTWSRCYDTPALADAADYVALMAYDQHVPSGPNAGSAAQFKWVESHVKRLVDFYQVPPGKLILGVPFYSRAWEMKPRAPLGGAFVKSSALYMSTAINNIWKYNAAVAWDDDSGQFVCEYSHSDKNFQLWLEDPASINLKLSLVHKYGLAGASAWSREFSIPEVWDVFERNLKQIMTYSQWQSEAFEEAPQMIRLDN